MSQYWGNRQWYWYHLVSYTSPDTLNIQSKKNYTEFIYLMTKLLPCKKCYEHFKLYLKETPIDFTTKETMIEWFVKAHNYVNKRLEKPILTVEDANKIYLIPSNFNPNDTEKETETNNQPNQLKEINHLFLNQFIKYHTDRALYLHSDMLLVAKLLEKLIYLYPCKICREILIEYNRKNPIRIYGIYYPTFRRWVSNFFDNQNFSNHFVKKWKDMS